MFKTSSRNEKTRNRVHFVMFRIRKHVYRVFKSCSMDECLVEGPRWLSSFSKHIGVFRVTQGQITKNGRKLEKLKNLQNLIEK